MNSERIRSNQQRAIGAPQTPAVDLVSVCLVTGLAAALAISAVILERHLIFDDAFISYRYARNLADGFGLVWNLGEAPVEGFTNLL